MPDSGHMGMIVLHEYYFLTGDRRAREPSSTSATPP